MGTSAHPPLHHRHLVHLRRGQARVEALLARDGAETGSPRSARPEGELATATVSLVACLLRQLALVCVLSIPSVSCVVTHVSHYVMCVFSSSHRPNV